MNVHSRIGISGSAILCPLGVNEDEVWDNLIYDRARFSEITHFDPLRGKKHRVGTISESLSTLPPQGHPNRLMALLVRVIREALQKSQLNPKEKRIGLVLGTTDIGGNAASYFYKKFRQGISLETKDGIDLLSALNGYHAETLKEKLGLQGPCFTLGNASAASAVALGVSKDLLHADECDAVIAVGGDCITESAFQGLFSLRTLAPEGCRPFHPERRGIRISEAACAFVLEKEDARWKEDRTPECILSGYGASHIGQNPARPDPEGIANAIQRALEEAKLKPCNIGYVNLHGAGTIHGDLAEAHALELVFGDGAKRIPISSTKPILGHCQGAAGMIEAFVVKKALQSLTLPHTAFLTEVDPRFEEFHLIKTPESAPDLKSGISISVGLGGTNTALVLSEAQVSSKERES